MARTNKKLDRLNYRLRDRFSGAAFLAPSFIGVAVFFIVPFCVVIYYSMIDSPIRHNFVFFENFLNVLNNGAFKIAAKNTLIFSATAVPLAVILSLALALLLECRIPLKSQFRTFFLSPMMVPVASVVLIWQVLFHNNGSVNELLALSGRSGLTGSNQITVRSSSRCCFYGKISGTT